MNVTDKLSVCTRERKHAHTRSHKQTRGEEAVKKATMHLRRGYTQRERRGGRGQRKRERTREGKERRTEVKRKEPKEEKEELGEWLGER